MNVSAQRKNLLLYAYIQASFFAVFAVLCIFTGKYPWDSNPFNSFTLQACAWLNGRLDLGENYPWLELAIYEGRYYVSFPPFPTFFLLPFAAVFGENTPETAISWGITMIGISYAIRLCRLAKVSDDYIPFLVLFLYLANGYVFVGFTGWVWFFAQTLCFTLSLMALYYAWKGRGGIAFSCWIFAVGCRPMILFYFPVLCVLLYRSSQKNKNIVSFFLKHMYWFVVPTIVGLAYLLLNALRFGDPFEFGHNYLPEFLEAPNGQFSFKYLSNNLSSYLQAPKLSAESSKLYIDIYGGIAFWLVNPIFVVAFFLWIKELKHAGHEAFRSLRFLLPLSVFVHLLLICCHKTLGGWQFGNRYLVDFLPFQFQGILIWTRDMRLFKRRCSPLYALGITMNLVGSAALYAEWL